MHAPNGDTLGLLIECLLGVDQLTIWSEVHIWTWSQVQLQDLCEKKESSKTKLEQCMRYPNGGGTLLGRSFYRTLKLGRTLWIPFSGEASSLHGLHHFLGIFLFHTAATTSNAGHVVVWSFQGQIVPKRLGCVPLQPIALEVPGRFWKAT